MIVLDASAVVDWLLQTAAGLRIESRIYSQHETLHTVHLLDLEVAQVLRRLTRHGGLSLQRADEALRDLLDLRMTRYSHSSLLPRVWRLRSHFSAYDASYVALAESLGAPLVTRDSGLASAPGHAARIELF